MGIPRHQIGSTKKISYSSGSVRTVACLQDLLPQGEESSGKQTFVEGWRDTAEGRLVSTSARTLFDHANMARFLLESAFRPSPIRDGEETTPSNAVATQRVGNAFTPTGL